MFKIQCPGVYLFNFTLVIVSWYDRLLLWRIVNLFKKGAKQRGQMKKQRSKMRANNKYNEKAYDRINITVPKSRKAEIKAHAESNGKVLTAL